MVFWKHFYKTFTPTCTTCEDCKEYFHSRNQNIPVDEKRFRRLQEREKTPYEVLEESEYQPIPLQQNTVKILHMWLEWTKLLAAGEDPREFLPRFGIEGRTLQEIRTSRLDEARDDEDDTGLDIVEEKEEDDEESYSSEVDEEDPESVARHRAGNLKRLRKTEISDDEDFRYGDEVNVEIKGEIHRGKVAEIKNDQYRVAFEDGSSKWQSASALTLVSEAKDGGFGFEYQQPHIRMATQALATLWLRKARQSLRAPNLQNWSQPGQWRYPAPPGAAPEGTQAALSLPSVPVPPQGGIAVAKGPPGVPPPPPLAPPPSGHGR
jgi:hypothetical protein